MVKMVNIIYPSWPIWVFCFSQKSFVHFKNEFPVTFVWPLVKGHRNFTLLVTVSNVVKFKYFHKIKAKYFIFRWGICKAHLNADAHKTAIERWKSLQTIKLNGNNSKVWNDIDDHFNIFENHSLPSIISVEWEFQVNRSSLPSYSNSNWKWSMYFLWPSQRPSSSMLSF